MNDPSFVALMWSSLPKSFDGLIVALESRPHEDVTVDYVKVKLLDEGRRRADGAFEDIALLSGGKNNTKFWKDRKLTTNKENQCHYCKKNGHIRKDCRKWAADKRSKLDGESVNVANEDNREEVCLFIGEGNGTAPWCFDSGATSHMTNDTYILKSIDNSKQSSISLANGGSIKSAGVGSCKLDFMDGNGKRKKVSLYRVYHVPSLATNLLSVSEITDNGFEVLFDRF